ncbi:hypothetical protein BJP36_38490 [Moorena producens JHB]|uniref:Uncharacterized protein n=1 Tax=Moorena producens (strain JHB) TaxID=1454205 RepID=A0A9Q9SUN6_MOOP1|nr:hypothetical protein [Moorena producens]WAN69969.1 hypothetical protein BJP36_38490 [Moorena producens JHB]
MTKVSNLSKRKSLNSDKGLLTFDFCYISDQLIAISYQPKGCGQRLTAPQVAWPTANG